MEKSEKRTWEKRINFPRLIVPQHKTIGLKNQKKQNTDRKIPISKLIAYALISCVLTFMLLENFQRFFAIPLWVHFIVYMMVGMTIYINIVELVEKIEVRKFLMCKIKSKFKRR